MKPLAPIGQKDDDIDYVDRPTVKVIIKRGDSVLLLNGGLLPGGGIDDDESEPDAITRELMEELGVTVGDVEKISTVIQYRNLLGKRYIVHGYSATLQSEDGEKNPQDEGEAQFSVAWLPLVEALDIVAWSIAEAKTKPMDDDINQGRLYNFMTTEALLKQLHATPQTAASQSTSANSSPSQN